MNTLAEEFIDKIEVARRLKKTPRTIELWTRCGIIPAIKIRRSVLYLWSDVKSALRKNFSLNDADKGEE